MQLLHIESYRRWWLYCNLQHQFERKKMKVCTKKFSIITNLSLLVFVMASSVCSAQGYSRSGKSEIFGMIQMIDSMEVTFDYPSIGLYDTGFELDSTNIYGLGIGCNVTDHWNVNMDLLFGSADGDFIVSGAKVPGISLDGDYFLWDINVDYNFLADRLSPLVTAGIGFTNMDIVATEPAMSSSEANFSYNVGAGGRWDITDNVLIKLVYRITRTQIEDANEKQDFTGVALSVAYMF